MLGDLAAMLSRAGIAPSTYATCAADWTMWVEWRQNLVQNGPYVDSSQGVDSIAEDIAKFLPFCSLLAKTTCLPFREKLSALQYFHLRAGTQLPAQRVFLQQVKSGLGRAPSIGERIKYGVQCHG